MAVRRWAAVVVLGACAGGVGGCAAPAGPSCVDTSGVTTAASGVIQAGPVDINRGYWTQPQGTKFWVGSDHPGPNGGADLTAVRADGTGDPIRRLRTPDQIAEVNSLALFYPGTFGVPSHGDWRLTVTISPNVGCFVIHA